ncbi:MAG: hypothetical protein GXO14_00395 [Thermococci archaeon]|nr:hypothetical protein [Thermococci archaeon]
MNSTPDFLFTVLVTKFVAFEGILLLLLIFNKLRRYTLRGRVVAALQILGGLMVIFGYTLQVRSLPELPRPVMFLVAAVGFFLVACPFVYYKTVRIENEYILQLAIMMASPLLTLTGRGAPLSVMIPGLLLIMAMLFAVRASLWLNLHTPFTKALLRTASWIIVTSSWVIHIASRTASQWLSYYLLLLYFTALVFWVYSLAKMYDHLGRWT